MQQRVLVVMQAQFIHSRIVRELQEGEVNPHFASFEELRTWLTQTQGIKAALVDSRYYEVRQVAVLLSRLDIPVEYFEGDFEQADDWVSKHRPVSDIEDETPTQPLNVTPVREDVPVPKKPIPVVESPIVEPKIIEREVIVEVPVEVEKTVYVERQVPLTLRPRLIVVKNLFPRAGASFVSMAVAHLLAQQLPEGSVSLVEHPGQEPFYWNYFRCETLVKGEYVHWLKDSRGSFIPRDKVLLAPLPADHVPQPQQLEKFITYVYKELRRPFVIVDLGQAEHEALTDMADDLFVIADWERIFIRRDSGPEKLRKIAQDKKAWLMLNRWTKQVRMKELLDGELPEISLPYLDPNMVQEALWKGVFPTEIPDVQANLESLQRNFTEHWIPAELRKQTTKSLFSFRRKDRK